MAITDWPTEERPRELLLTQGPHQLTDAQLLAIFLRVGVRGKSAVDLARDLIQQFGDIRGLMDSDPDEVFLHPGIGPAKYSQLLAALELGKRYLHSELKRTDVMRNPRVTSDYLRAKLRPYQQEVFAALFLDTQHRVICFETIFFGSIDSATVHPREVVKRALKHNAAALIVAHNHPSGISEPSEADILVTQQLKKALELVDVRLLDHIVVGDNTTSLAERGALY
ncbi:MAG TPA: DNA repair protein RadC [Pseudomonadales bacterium]|nr:DNA repair protein RadC [Pseudomonadales bacterium]